MRPAPALLALAAVTAAALAAPSASAAPPWVDRHLTMPAGTWAFDMGLGIGHVPGPPDTAAGINLEAAVGLTDRLLLGVRTGLRFGDPGDRAIEPDDYGRLFDRQYVGGRDDVLANPELRILGALLHGPLLDLGLEGRLFVPIEGNQAALEFGVPIALHLGDSVRLDTGAYIPMVLDYNPPFGFIVPIDLWVQLSPRFWLGPMTGFNVVRYGDDLTQTQVSMGFGVGYQILRNLDFKSMFLFPALNQDSRIFGLGAGVQIRLE
ncbi:MAG TPA: hypothetical protein VGL81_20635 [Polyangiaceae bacterium]|jgi:hypothetical protein